MTNKIIQKLFDQRLETWGDDNDYAIALENKSFDPTKDAKDGRYLEGQLLPATTVSQDLAGAHRGYRGVYQIDIHVRKRIGTGSADSIVDLLAALFPLNLRLTDTSGLVVQIVTPVSPGPALARDSTWLVPVSFNYQSDNF